MPCPKNSPQCTRATPCRSCLGRRARRYGLRKQRDARKRLDAIFGIVPPPRHISGNEEAWQHPLRVEVKSGRQVAPIERLYHNSKQQAADDERPFAMVAMPANTSRALVIIDIDDLAALIRKETQ